LFAVAANPHNNTQGPRDSRGRLSLEATRPVKYQLNPRFAGGIRMLHRREAMIRLGQVGLGSLTLPSLLRAESDMRTSTGGKAKSCILLFLWGGPSQPDMWDLKPDAPDGIRSQFRPIATTVPGIHVCDQMPHLARQIDKVTIVRSMSHESNNHEPSVYHTMTGRRNPTLVVPANARKRTDFPGVGSIVSAFAPLSALPASVTIPQPVGHDGFNYAGTYAGFLGPRHDPMELRQVTAQSTKSEGMHSLTLPAELTRARLVARHGLLKLMETEDRRRQSMPSSRGLDSTREQAYRLVASPAARRAFDLESEDPRLRDRYGRNEYGESFLLARRLVEAGVRLVTATWLYFVPVTNRILNVWDTHGGTPDLGNASGYAMLRSSYGIPPFDLAYSALLEDLAARGLLEETLVVAVGEFGRTPRINPAQGREHWGMCYSALLAGGGIRGGQVYGASDKWGAYPKESPVAPEDLLATIYDALGIPTDAVIRDREDRPFRITEGTPVTALFG
jgi:hypothetical protein